MSDSQRINTGGWYLVDIERAHVRVKAVEQPREMPGWWICETASGQQLGVPQESMREVSD